MVSKKIFSSSTFILLSFNCVLFGFVGYFFFTLQSKTRTPSAVLAPHIEMQTLELNVVHLDAMGKFYSELLGMEQRDEANGKATLGFGKQTVLILNDTPSLPKGGMSDPGVDQIAMVFSSRPGLAKALQRILNVNPSLYLGGTNRGAIGEAFYVSDPEGNVLELYFDTDPSTWPRSAKGNPEGDSLPIDVNTYIKQYGSQVGDTAIKLGHIQLRIGNMDTANKFYVDTLGFYVVPRLIGNGSLFLSDGYYHHDVVLSQAPGYDGDSISNYAGMKGFSIGLPSWFYLHELSKRLDAAHAPYRWQEDALSLQDPWGIQLTFRSPKRSVIDLLHTLVASL